METVKQLYKKKDKIRVWMNGGDIQESKRKKFLKRWPPCKNLMRGNKFIKEIYNWKQ